VQQTHRARRRRGSRRCYIIPIPRNTGIRNPL
jgi:hypothetical protein